MILVYPIGIPLTYFVMLWQHRDTLSDPMAVDREETTGFPTIGHLQFLCSSYKCQFYNFEVGSRKGGGVWSFV